jgi:hypothetical protein
MEEVIGEIAKGFFRGIGYILAEIFFWNICYWIGWPICKLVTLGAYPKSEKTVYIDDSRHSGVWCAVVGLIVVVIFVLYFLGVFSTQA